MYQKFSRSQLTRALAHVGNRIEADDVVDKKYIEMLDAAGKLLDQPRLGEQVQLLIRGKGVDVRNEHQWTSVKPGDKFVIMEMVNLGDQLGVAYTLENNEGIVFTAYTGHFKVLD